MSEADPGAASDGARRPNIVVFVLDSVRYDRTSLAEGGPATTPNLERIADRADGRSYDTAIAHTRYTLPSSGSILTGRYPGDHGLGFGCNSLDPDIPTVAESLRGAGYTTALVSNNYFVSPETGLDRGFETTTVLPTSPVELLKTVGVKGVARWLANIRSHSAGFELDKYRHSGAYLTTQLVEQRLDALGESEEPFFLYVHYNQPHRPYYPPLSWFEKYGDRFEMSRREAGEFAMEVHDNLVEKVAEGCPFTDDEWATLRALYDAGIEYTDTFVGSLFDRIRAEFDDTVVVATADHGEHLGERGALGHKYVLDDAVLRVPLVTAGLDDAAAAGPVQHTDVMRTLLAEAGADCGFVDGVDLRDESRPFAVSQDGARSLDPLYEANPDFDATQFPCGAGGSLPRRTTIRTPTHRYVRGADDTSALFELPDETTDISAEVPETAATYDAELEAWLADHESVATTGSDDAISASTKSRLQNMGYLDGEL